MRVEYVQYTCDECGKESGHLLLDDSPGFIHMSVNYKSYDFCCIDCAVAHLARVGITLEVTK